MCGEIWRKHSNLERVKFQIFKGISMLLNTIFSYISWSLNWKDSDIFRGVSPND